MKLFDALISPILFYVSEVIGGLIAMDNNYKKTQQKKFKINSCSGCWNSINTAIIMHAGLRQGGFQ